MVIWYIYLKLSQISFEILKKLHMQIIFRNIEFFSKKLIFNRNELFFAKNHRTPL